MKNLLVILIMIQVMTDEIKISDFDNDSTLEWIIVNDGVMGGISQSKLENHSDSTSVFSGIVSPENNGGFASIRAKIKYTYDDFEGVIIKVKGDSNTYSLRFRTDNYFDGYSYAAKFKTERNKWMETKIPFTDFLPTFRGRTLNNKPLLRSENIRQIGFLISAKQFGEFKLEID